VKNPAVSAIVVSWNHRDLLPDCLDALLAQDYSPLDVTVVDNGSQDGTPAWLGEAYPAVRLQAFPDNRGFSHAVNWGVRHTQGDLILSLNPDTVVRDRFVRELVQAATQSERIGIVAPKLLRADDPVLLDSTGLFVDRRRRTYDRGQGKPNRGQYDVSANGSPSVGLRVFGACGAAALYRRAMLEDVALDGEYFDEDFFAYYEDADLSWRAQSRGWFCIYAPLAVATHARGWGDALRKAGHATKGSAGPRLALCNRYLMTIKNDALSHFVKDLPQIVAAELPRLAYMTLTRPTALLGILDLIRATPSAMHKRRQIRSRRVVDDTVVRRWFVAPTEAAASQGDGSCASC
jgi:GT2 family glycosyltransferase